MVVLPDNAGKAADLGRRLSDTVVHGHQGLAFERQSGGSVGLVRKPLYNLPQLHAILRDIVAAE